MFGRVCVFCFALTGRLAQIRSGSELTSPTMLLTDSDPAYAAENIVDGGAFPFAGHLFAQEKKTP